MVGKKDNMEPPGRNSIGGKKKNSNETTIPISKQTRSRLKVFCAGQGLKYDDAINRMLDIISITSLPTNNNYNYQTIRNK